MAGAIASPTCRKRACMSHLSFAIYVHNLPESPRTLGDFVGGEGEPSCTKGRKTISSCGVLKHVFDQERGSAQKLRDQRRCLVTSQPKYNMLLVAQGTSFWSLALGTKEQRRLANTRMLYSRKQAWLVGGARKQVRHTAASVSSRGGQPRLKPYAFTP